MKILITGGAGFIGSHLAEKLLEKGDEVFVLDDLSTGSLNNIKHLEDNPHFHFQEGSVLDRGLVEKMAESMDRIYHLAAAVGVKMILGRPLHSLLTNIKGAEIILEEASRRNIKTLITSSSEVCGKDNPPKGGFKEDDARTYGSVYNDRWVYAFSKAVDEFLALAYSQEKKLPVVVVRLFNVIGPRQTGAYGMVVPAFIKQALKGEDITVYGTGKQTRCFANVDDATSALIKLMENKEAEGAITNVGADDEISMDDLAHKVKRIAGSNSKIVHIPYEEAYPAGYEDFMRRVPNLSRVKQLINYQPKITLAQSIEQIIDYFKECGAIS